ncbi:MAG: hypothetical protein M0R33_13715 [Methylomonas sp.]|nr:hypothetical protein [Methylomonas sp.]
METDTFLEEKQLPDENSNFIRVYASGIADLCCDDGAIAAAGAIKNAHRLFEFLHNKIDIPLLQMASENPDTLFEIEIVIEHQPSSIKIGHSQRVRGISQQIEAQIVYHYANWYFAEGKPLRANIVLISPKQKNILSERILHSLESFSANARFVMEKDCCVSGAAESAAPSAKKGRRKPKNVKTRTQRKEPAQYVAGLIWRICDCAIAKEDWVKSRNLKMALPRSDLADAFIQILASGAFATI